MRFSLWEGGLRALSLSGLRNTQKTLTSSNRNSNSNSNRLSMIGKEVPGGTPFRFCHVSSPTDLFNITSVELTRQPVYIDDEFTVNIYGNFLDTFGENATLSVREDCGSHCEEYGHPPGSGGTIIKEDFCLMSEIMQPLGSKRNVTCPPPEKGWALVTSWGYIWPLFLNVPGWYNFTFDAKTVDGKRIYCLTTEVCLRYENEDKNKGYPPGPWNNCTWPR
ncbi:hypothetical protein B0H66DRAFT_621771 [Apodospora peruviana]|uniref:MD-2-related lipid-recognition domain-containing protein n=1 Tax=Apodospora peruviana TaxID=516989 RepID=A0AAE0M3U9_9PEZI|nr:hypothetical protein B0H66DRAFT_621771 [Apodospora peruviana]